MRRASQRGRARAVGLVGGAAIGAGLAASCAPAEEAPAAPVCIAELRSWAVVEPHPGRHLYLEVDCPPAHGVFSGRIEFTTAALRSDFDASANAAGPPGVARYTRGRRLAPIVGDAARSDRLEYRYTLTLDQVRCMQRDRLWRAPYTLVGTNSSSGMRAALESCGCTLPHRVLRGGGLLGAFPGIDLDPGPEVPAVEWAAHGLPRGPTPPAPSG